ncbi:glycine--tRNA ligase subunit beta [Lysobacter brunescens]|uniref:Glycine--tRNA ligase beta subunit n=1 Tax=Lysobacter brunescens TaxID=262323 RepID=A0ABW2Y7W2_9GAMM
MSGFSPLLIELGTEELPVKALPGLAQAFFDGVIAALDKRGIACQRDGARPLYTPRRLAVCLPGVAVEQPEQRSEVLGPYLNIALDAEGRPTKALEGFAAKSGIDWTVLEKTTDNKGERFVLRTVKPGAKTADLLPEVVAEALAGMPIPKPMRWGERDSGFARPVHWLVLLLGDSVVDAEVFGAKADRMSRGHRFHHEGPVWISTPGDYIDALRAAKVLVDPEERRHRVVAEVDAAAARAGGTARKTEDNLEQVQCLVEWPKAVLCAFEREFLAVPQEALIATMEANQKFFPVLDADGKLTEHFIGIANIESRDESEVRKGYERVIRPRFADAKFFFDEDLKQGLASMNEGLKTVTYQAKLGTVADKVARVAALAESIAGEVGVDPKLAKRAALLAKADLQSRMVNEFPELQGIAGRYYAMHDASLNDLSADERKQLADALDEVYMPRFAGDAIAPSKLGQVLAIAERLDTLAGGFAAGLKPTGNKDPFSLRRNALGLARTVIAASDIDVFFELLRALIEAENDIVYVPRHENLSKQLEKAKTDSFQVSNRHDVIESLASEIQNLRIARINKNLGVKENPELASEIFGFILDRLRAYYADQGVTPQQFEAVATRVAPTRSEDATAAVGATQVATNEAANTGSLLDFDRRLKAIGEFVKLPEAEALAAANKRIRNILKKADIAIPDAVDASKFQDDAERALHAVVEQAIADTDPLLASRDYVAVLARLARLRPEVDTFFDKVMVNAEDQAVRANRLALLQRLADRLGSVAAIEHLSV